MKNKRLPTDWHSATPARFNYTEFQPLSRLLWAHHHYSHNQHTTSDKDSQSLNRTDTAHGVIRHEAFTAEVCKISGLKDARTRLQTVYFPVR